MRRGAIADDTELQSTWPTENIQKGELRTHGIILEAKTISKSAGDCREDLDSGREDEGEQHEAEKTDDPRSDARP